MAKYTCDNCKRQGEAPECAVCASKFEEMPTHYIPLQATDSAEEQITLLNALAVIMQTCEKHGQDGCSLTCPMRRPQDEQDEGLGFCAFESPSAPIDWNLSEPEEENPILLYIDFNQSLLDENEEEDEWPPWFR